MLSMDSKNIIDLDRQISRMEKDLSALYQKRVAILEEDIRRCQAQISAFGGANGPVAPAPAPKQAKAKKAAKAVSAPAAKVSSPEVEVAPEVPVAAPAKKAAAPRKAKQKKRTRTPTAEVEKRILDALKDAGLFGLSQVEVSKKSNLGYQTVVKKLKEMPEIVKKGSGREGRYYLKA